MSPRARSADRRPLASDIIEPMEGSLLDVIDNLLNKGVVVNGEVMLSIADVDLIYLRLSALFCAADRVLPTGGRPARPRRTQEAMASASKGKSAIKKRSR